MPGIGCPRERETDTTPFDVIDRTPHHGGLIVQRGSLLRARTPGFDYKHVPHQAFCLFWQQRLRSGLDGGSRAFLAADAAAFIKGRESFQAVPFRVCRQRGYIEGQATLRQDYFILCVF